MSNNYKNSTNLQQLANCIRFLAIDAVQQANSGHPGMPMGMADIATILFKNHLKFDPQLTAEFRDGRGTPLLAGDQNNSEVRFIKWRTSSLPTQ